MNLALRLLLTGSAPPISGGGGGLPPTSEVWSVKYAGVGAGADIMVHGDILFDLPNSPDYGSVHVMGGTVVVDRSKTTRLNCRELMIDSGGTYWAGDTANPYPRYPFTHTIEGLGERASDPFIASPITAGMATQRAISVMGGGTLALVAEVPTRTKVYLAQTVNPGDTSMTLEAGVTWKAGDQVWLTSTKYEAEGDHIGRELVVVTADTLGSAVVSITAAVYRHYGLLQYIVAPANESPVARNLSNTKTTILAGDNFGTVGGQPYLGSRVLASIAAGATDTLDNRGEALLLTHSIKLQGRNDANWTSHGYGISCMFMGLTSKVMIRGVQVDRCGKAGFLGAYPLHHHMRSYTAFGDTSGVSGTYLGDVNMANNFAEHFSVRNSSNRGFTIHGTCGLRISSGSLVNIDTHAVFFEDGSEERNICEDTTASGVNYIGYGKAPIKVHDTHQGGNTGDTGPAGCWYTNPNNHLRRMHYDGGMIGQWNTFAKRYYTGRNTRGTRTGNGSLVFTNITNDGEGGTAETIVMSAINATTFQRVGSVSGTLANVSVGTLAYHGPNSQADADTSKGVWRYTIYAGSTPFVTGDQFIFDAILNPGGCFGASRDCTIEPWSTRILEWDDIQSHSQLFTNQLTGGDVIDEAGNINQAHFGKGASYNGDGTDTHLKRARMWKPGKHWYVNFLQRNDYEGFICSAGAKFDATVDFLIRGVTNGKFRTPVFITNTLDDAYPNADVQQVVTYDGGVFFQDYIFIPTAMSGAAMGTTNVGSFSQHGGTFRLYDFYVYPTITFFSYFKGAVIGATPGYLGLMAAPLQLLGRFPTLLAAMNASGGIPVPATTTPTSAWNQENAGARLLPADGSLFNTSGWWVCNDPYFTDGLSVLATCDVPSGLSPGDNGVVVSSAIDFFGIYFMSKRFADYYGGPDNLFYNEIHFSLLADGTEAVVSTWDFPYNQYDQVLSNMRSSTLRQDRMFDVRWPRNSSGLTSLPSELYARIYLPRNTGSFCRLRLDFSGSAGAGLAANGVGLWAYGAIRRVKTPFANKAALLASTALGYWLDTANNKLYVNLGITPSDISAFTNSGFMYETNILCNVP